MEVVGMDAKEEYISEEEEEWEHDQIIPTINLRKSGVFTENLEYEFQPDVVFVGAGPVGLWTAIQLKILQPKLNILMLEKYEKYQRNHVLRVSPASFKHSVKDEIPIDGTLHSKS